MSKGPEDKGMREEKDFSAMVRGKYTHEQQVSHFLSSSVVQDQILLVLLLSLFG